MKSSSECDNRWLQNRFRFEAKWAKAISLGALLGMAGITTTYSQVENPPSRVIPRPKVEIYETGNFPIAQKGEAILIRASESTPSQVKPIQEGVALLSDRLGFLGATNTRLLKAPRGHHILINKCSEDELAQISRSAGADEKLDARRLAQSYYLRTQPSQSHGPVVTIQACQRSGALLWIAELLSAGG